MRYLISGTSLQNTKSLAGSLGRTLLGLNSQSTPHAWQIVSRRADEADTLTRQLNLNLGADLNSSFDSVVYGSLVPQHAEDIAKEFKSARATGLVLLPDAVEPHQWNESQSLLAAARLANLKHIILISTYAAHSASLLPSGVAWATLEKEAEETKLPLTIIRPTTFMQSMLFGSWSESICGRNLSVSMSNACIAFVHSLDVAEVVNHTMAKPASPSSTVHLTGPEALTWDDVVRTFSKYLDSPVRLSKVPLWVVQPSLWIRGKNPDDIREIINQSKYYEAGGESEVTSTVESILGRPPLSFESFVAANKMQWPQLHR
ncbi:hypothetical protein H310_01194 [Aphanomyces invadans]|uniref:Uncharacterized protein n=1 Tax=Aphanomyces invadans TaxID=157072 RepID=A0A024US07_9STRA|nr:hypothetical protein H310_01194 [Aphanomyces invadans]ETW08662.1 hypothetical protein H310_01194 [Aphanomyces invadans]|eukprot:XP_008862467.1 hypothetical protein H310_01194 [Aphanomyces invadans]